VKKSAKCFHRNMSNLKVLNNFMVACMHYYWYLTVTFRSIFGYTAFHCLIHVIVLHADLLLLFYSTSRISNILYIANAVPESCLTALTNIKLLRSCSASDEHYHSNHLYLLLGCYGKHYKTISSTMWWAGV